MQIKPLSSHREPGYPSRDAVAGSPDLLISSTPDIWKHKKVVATSLLAFALAGCKPKHDCNTVAQGKETFQQDCRKPADNCMQENGSFIAPLFIHGDGRGAFGCVVTAGPVFLSEEDARKIIFDELKKENVIFDQFDKTMPDLKMPVNYEDLGIVDRLKTLGGKSLTLDAFSTKLNLGIEYVSSFDYADLGGYISNSTFQEIDTKQAAMTLQCEAVNYGKINLAVFYDPMPIERITNDSHEAREKSKKESEEYSRELLRAQVHDFIELLKTTDIIKKDKSIK